MKAIPLRNLFLYVLALLLGISCSKEVGPGELRYGSVFTTVLEQPTGETRTSLSGANVLWSAGDEIGILSEGRNSRLLMSSKGGTASASFTGMVPEAELYVGLYPYDASASCSDGVVSFNLPATQTYVSGSFGPGANPAVTVFRDRCEELYFRNICGILSIPLKGTGTVTKMELSDKNGANLWGSYTIVADETAGTNSQTLSYVNGGGKTLTLDCGSGVTLSSSPREFMFVVPPGLFSNGFEVLVSFIGGKTLTLSTDNDVTIRRSRIEAMAERKVDATVYFCLENDVVKDYIDYVYAHPYPDGDYTYTYIEDFCYINTTYRKDHPFPVMIEWTRDASASSQEIIVSEHKDLAAPVFTYAVENNAESAELYNLVPGKTYYYAVVARTGSSSKVIQASEFNTMGHRRFLYIDGIYNVRDLGGIPTADGKKRIRYEKVFRGSRMNAENLSITEKGIAQMKQAGIMADLDLREDLQADFITTSPLGEEIDYKRFPFASSGLYQLINEISTNVEEMQWLIDELRTGRPVFFHCSIGADRTGTLAFLIEGLLGVSENDMSIDYELTSFSSLPGTRRRIVGAFDYPGMYAALCTVPGETLQAKFYNYFLNGVAGVSISADDLDWFIDYMLEDMP